MYSIGDLGRREILMMSAVLAGASIVFPTRKATAEAKLQRTPDQILGPFYPLSELPQTADLTRVSGRSGRAEGQVLNSESSYGPYQEVSKWRWKSETSPNGCKHHSLFSRRPGRRTKAVVSS